MIHSLAMAFRYMRYHGVRTVILVVCLSVAWFLPLAVHLLVSYYNRIMIERADETPMVVGAKGSAYDLVLNTLYFKGRLEQRLSMAEARTIRAGGLATAVPMHVRFTTGGTPIVGTTLDYFAFRKLTVARGSLPRILGDVVLGSAAARRLGLDVGEKLLSDQEKVYDISSNYPLLMHVVGVLAESGTADDLVVFTDVKTTWIIEGLGHGHADARRISDPSLLTGVDGTNIVMSAAVMQYNEITPESLDEFHFHGDDREYSLSAIIALPHDAKSATIFKARYRLSEDAQALVPTRVVEAMMDIVSRVKRFFDAVFAVVVASTGLFLLLVVLLSLRIRRREFQTLHKIGCSRSTVFALQAAEIVLLLAAGLLVAGCMLGGMMWYVVRFDVLL